jgi:hypothetical protein
MYIISVKVHGSNSLSKDVLREEGAPWLTKRPGECNLTNVEHFKTPPHVWHYCQNKWTERGEKPNNWKKLALIPC